MAHIKCKTCGAIVSDLSPICPSCGNHPTKPSLSQAGDQDTIIQREERHSVSEDTIIEQPKVEREQPRVTPKQPNSNKKDGGNNKTLIICIIIIACLICIGIVLGVLIVNKDNKANRDLSQSKPTPSQTVTPPKTDETPEVPEPVVTEFDYDVWTDMNYRYNYKSITALGYNRYKFRTTNLDYTPIDRMPHKFHVSDTGYVTPDVLRVRNVAYASEDKKSILAGICYGAEVRIKELYPNNWARIEYINGKYEGVLRGDLYVCMDFLLPKDKFKILDRHIIANEDDLKRFEFSKWSIAAADAITLAGATPYGIKIDVEIDYVKRFEGTKNSVVAFRLSRKDSNVRLLAIIEFFEDNNNYRILAIIPGMSVDDINYYRDGDYLIRYTDK